MEREDLTRPPENQLRRWLLVATMLATTALPLSAQKSNSSGVMINAVIHSTSLAIEDSDTSESGVGVGVRVGWGITRNVTLFLGIDTSSIQTEDPSINNGTFGLMQADLGGIYTFRAGMSFLPYLEAAIGTRRITSDITVADPDGVITEGRVITKGTAVSFGGGFNYYVARPLALNAGLSVSTGHFGDYKVNDTRLHKTNFNATSARLRFGLTWYPINR